MKIFVQISEKRLGKSGLNVVAYPMSKSVFCLCMNVLIGFVSRYLFVLFAYFFNHSSFYAYARKLITISYHGCFVLLCVIG